MTRQYNRSSSILCGIAPFIAVLTVGIALAALGQTRVPGTSGAPAPMTRLESGRFVADAAEPDLDLFLPGETYLLEGFDGRSVAAADINGDGVPDLLVGSRCTNIHCRTVGVIDVFLGQGDGTFRAVGSYDSYGAPLTSVAIADLNGDGKPEMVATSICSFEDCSTGIVNIHTGNGDGTFNGGSFVFNSGAQGAREVAIADVNGDGKPDLVIANCGGSNCDSSAGVVGVLLGNGDATFQPVVTYASGGIDATSVAVADVNGDGKLDLVVANLCATLTNCPGSVDGSVAVLLGNGDGTFQAAVVYDSGGKSADSVRVADLNGDGKADIVVANGFSTEVGVLLGNGNGTFQAAVVYATGNTSEIAVADVNQDGKPDLVLSDGGFGVLLGNGDGTFQPLVFFGVGEDRSLSVAVADMNGDGRPDAVLVNECSNSKCAHGSASVLLNNSGSHSPTTTALVPNVNPAAVNQQVIYTATVTNQSGGPITGTVVFNHGSSTTVQIKNGQASYSTSYTKTGKHSITATYSGDTSNETSTSATLIEYIGLAPTTTTLTTSGSPSHVGQPVTFTATVAWTYGTVPNGELVTFFDGSTEIGTGTTASSVAMFTTSSLTKKTHKMKAIYAGDASFGTSTGKVTQVVEE